MFRSKRSAYSLTGLLAGVTLMAAACGGGGGAGGTTLTAKSIGPYDPNELTVKVNEAVTVNLVNKDAVTHDFVTRGLAKEFKVSVAAGKTGSVTFTADKAGTFEFFCSEPGHEAAGMKGKLIVK